MLYLRSILKRRLIKIVIRSRNTNYIYNNSNVVVVVHQPRPSRKEGLNGSWPPEQTDLSATLPPSEVKREGPVECKLSRSDDEAGNGRVGVSVSERRSPQVRSVTRRGCQFLISLEITVFFLNLNSYIRCLNSFGM